MSTVNYNERSWAIDLITDINLWLVNKNVSIKRAGGENTIRSGVRPLFPDVLLFGDEARGRILQGWELKMPDTPIDDAEFIKNAKTKAKLLTLNSFLLWNVSSAVLYKIESDDSLTVIKNWNNLSHITAREEVVQNRSQITTMLSEILNDLSGYVLDGTVKTISVVDALTSETISELVQRNIGSYVDALKSATRADNIFLNEIVIWWRYAKNDYPEEPDKFVVLARNNLLFLVNKFIFAHILKSYQSNANSVDQIDQSMSVNDALIIFNKISIKCDFWNIFQTQKGEAYVTQDIWDSILSFNEFLKQLNFSKIDKSLLHDLIGLTVYKNKRKFAGQFSTPTELAKFIVTLTVKDKALLAIDPCCGSGTIVKEIYNTKKIFIGIENSLSTLWASDKFSLPLQMAMFNLADPEALGYLIRIFKEDATKLAPGKNIEFHQPFNGKAVNETLPRFGYIISNLPFVQQEDLEILNPNIAEINDLLKEKLGCEVELDSRSDLYAYLPFYFWNILDTSGIVSIIASNSWLGTAWGQKFYDILSCFYQIENITTSGYGRWFSNAKVVTNIITLKKRDIPTIPNDNEIIKFSVTNKSLLEYTPAEMEEFSALVSRGQSIEEDDISLNSYTVDQIKQIQGLGLNLNSFFANNAFIQGISDKLVKVSDYFDIGRGERRGWDPLFYPEANNGIEPEYLKPVLKTPRHIERLVAQPDAVAFCCDKSKQELISLGHSGAISWIEKFEGQANEKGVPLISALARGGIYWYTMLPATMAEIVTAVNFGDRLYFARFNESTFVNQRLVRFSRKTENVDFKLCHALMNSLISLFYIEAMGTGRGEGALDLSKDKIEDGLRIVNPSLITTEKRTQILALFERLEARDILPITDELKSSDRNDFDDAVLDAVGCLPYKDQIKKALLRLYQIRTAVSR